MKHRHLSARHPASALFLAAALACVPACATTVNAPLPPAKVEQNACLVDPWGRRYSYYYRNANNAAGWQATGYVLYSAGPRVAANGTQTAPLNPTNGLLLATQTAEMLDNIYASAP